MTDGKRPNAAQRLTERLEQAAALKRVECIKAAQSAIAASIEASVTAKLRDHDYLICYRISDGPEPNFGTATQRRAALVEVIRSMKPYERHLSTSTWFVKVPLRGEKLLREPLETLLDHRYDFLSVTEVSTNRSSFGNADLEA